MLLELLLIVSAARADAPPANSLQAHVGLLAHPEALTAPASGPKVVREVRDLVESYAPRIWWHENEKHAASDPLDFIRNSSLWFRRGWGRNQLVAAKGAIDLRELARTQSYPFRSGTFAKDTGFFLKLEGASRAPASAPKPPPMLWRLGRPTGDPRKVVIEYWYHSAENVATGSGVGNHQGDWEGMAMLVDLDVDTDGKFSHRPLAAYYSMHDGGAWRCAKQIEWTPQIDGRSHPIGFSALGTHATYPEPGTHKSLLITDRASQGHAWNSWTSLRPLALEPYYGFSGAWGEVRLVAFMSGPLPPGPGFKYIPKDQPQFSSEVGQLASLDRLRSSCSF